MRIASSRFTAPIPVVRPVLTGWSNDTATKLCAARLYTSCGRDFSRRRTPEPKSVRSNSISVRRSCRAMPRSSMRQKLTELPRRNVPYTR